MRILIVGDYPTMEEARKKKPFSSEAGNEFKTLLHKAGISLRDCIFTSLAQDYPSRGQMYEFFHPNTETKGKSGDTYGCFPRENLIQWFNTLHSDIRRLRPDMIIAAGSYALWALWGEHGEVKIQSQKGTKVPVGITNWRGSQLHYTRSGLNIPLLPVLDQYITNKVFSWSYKTSLDLRRCMQIMPRGDWDTPQYNFYIRPSFAQTMAFIRLQITNLDIAERKNTTYKLACDLETFAGHITCCGFAWSDRDAFCIPLLTGDGLTNLKPYWSFREELMIVNELRILFNHPALHLLGQNFLYDAQHIMFSWQIKVKISSDTMIQQHLVYPGTELDLNTISAMHCKHHRYWKADGKFWKDEGVTEEDYWTYNCQDCVITYEAGESLNNYITFYKQEEQWEYQIRQLNAILTIMIRGVLIDQEAKHIASHELQKTIEEYEEKLRTMLPSHVYEQPPKVSPWYRSHKQLSHIFTNLFGQKRYWNRKKKAYTMDSAALAEYAKREPILRELCETLIAYGSLTTFTTFTEMKLGVDGRMRSSYSPTTVTYRWRSSADAFGTGGNLQNLPKGNE